MMTGGCLCGAVRYEADGQPEFVGYCHCRDCQRVTGSGFSPFMGIAKSAVRVTGRTRAFTALGGSGKPTTRHSCPVCASTLFGEPEVAEGYYTLYAGCLDDPSQFVPQMAMFTRDRPAWAHMVGDLPEFARTPYEP